MIGAGETLYMPAVFLWIICEKGQKSVIIVTMDIKREDIMHLADLSDFTLSDTEIDSLGDDLKGIIKYISQLEELDTDKVEPTYQVFEMENIWRADEVLPQDATREELLATTKEEKDNQAKVPKVL